VSGKQRLGHYSHAARPPSVDSQRWLIEFEAQQKHTFGVHEDDVLEAMHRMVIDLLEKGHTPSRDMMGSIIAELKDKWWPVGSRLQQRQHGKERAFVINVRREITYWAEKKYGNVRGARTRAEQDIANMRDISVEVLRKRLERYGVRLEKRKAELERQRKRPLRRK
jgi:hypothetical protein